MGRHIGRSVRQRFEEHSAAAGAVPGIGDHDRRFDVWVSHAESVRHDAPSLASAVVGAWPQSRSNTALPTHSQLIPTSGGHWWEAGEFEALERAVEEVFADPSPSTDTYWATDLSYVLESPWSPSPVPAPESLTFRPPAPGHTPFEAPAENTPAFGMAVADPTPSGELVRPYVSGLSATAFPLAAGWTDGSAVPPPTPVDRVHRSPMAAGDGCRLPSRRELRLREREANSAKAIALRRMAKGGVLMATAFGVVVVIAPQVVPAGDASVVLATANLHDPHPGKGSGAQGSGARATGGEAAAANSTVNALLSAQLIKESAQAQSVGQAARGAGAVAIAVAEAQATAEKARVAALARAERDAQREPQSLARLMVSARGWSAAQFSCLDKLYERESGWRWNAGNPSSGAYGLGQALPASKMAPYGADYKTNPATQLKWGLDYIADRYGTPCAAWEHSENTSPHWY